MSEEVSKHWECKNCGAMVSVATTIPQLKNPNRRTVWIDDDGEEHEVGCASCGSTKGYRLVFDQLPPEVEEERREP